MIPGFEAAVASVSPGGIAPVCRTPFGFHVIRRDPVERMAARHILVPWTDAWRSVATRSRDEARARVEEARRALDAGEAFPDVAIRFGEDPVSPDGDLGVFGTGQLLPALEEAVRALEPGAVSGIVETAYGFHLVQRTDDAP